MPVPPFRVTFPELLPDAIAAAAGKQPGDDTGADASLEPLQVEVRFALARRAAMARAGSRRYALLLCDQRCGKQHISTESF
jgi:hypothetical protein